MTDSVPIFIAYIKDDSLAHIVAGVEPETLCNAEDVYTASQVEVEGLNNPESVMKDETEFCEQCQETWENVASDHIVTEVTQECHGCETRYSGHRLRAVEHISGEKEFLCKPCYKLVRESEESTVERSYEEAERFMKSHGSREFSIPEEEE